MIEFTKNEEAIEEIGKSNKIYEDFYDLSSKLKIEYIQKYVSDINWKIEYIFEIIKKMHDKVLLKTFYLELKNIFQTYFSFGSRKEFESMINDHANILILEKDSAKFYNDFKDDFESIKNKMNYIFKKYYELVYESGKKEDYKELYSYYQTLLLSILYMLPETYAQKMLNIEDYSEVKKAIKIFKYDSSLEDINVRSIYFDSLELSIRKHIFQKYNVDIYDKEAILTKKV